MKQNNLLLGLLLSLYLLPTMASDYLPHYYCTASNSRYYPMLINLIGSIFKFNYDKVGEIMVFNLGLSQAELDELNGIDKVKVYEVEKTHPDIIAVHIMPKTGRGVIGEFAWKPVIIKQALDKYEYILYLDAGT